MNSPLTFHLNKISSSTAARAGTLITRNSVIETPVFMPVGTHAIVRGQHQETLKDLDYRVLLANTYHLLLRPGADVFRTHGGIHSFMQWPHSILTDSGGYQIFSLARFLRMTERGACFRSYVDGKMILLGPEESIGMQTAINSDIMMALDQCVPAQVDYNTALSALELTERWAKRSLAARTNPAQALFGIVQGATYPDLRSLSAEMITALPFDGFALGGLAVGEDKEVRDEIVAHSAQLLPAHRPRYLMGVGTPIDLLEAVYRGIDMFDCILPASLGQQGVCFTSSGKMTLSRGVYKHDVAPLDANCSCYACATYSRSYLHHLIKVGEYIGGSLIALHNLTFYRTLMREIRSAILKDSFESYYREKRLELIRIDPEYPRCPMRKAV